MPATAEEITAYVRLLADGAAMPDSLATWADGTQPTNEERQEILAVLRYELRLRLDRARQAETRPARRRAMALLRRFLSPAQSASLDRSGHFTVTTPRGRFFRLSPRHARIEEVQRHGTRCYAVRSFCLHPDPLRALPAPDVTLAQVLLLLADEGAFLREANATERSGQLWNGAYLRRIAAGRRSRRMEVHDA